MSKEIKTQLRTTPERHQWLVATAKNEEISMNALINRLIKKEMERESNG